MSDLIEEYHKFATKVANILTEAKLEPQGDDTAYAVMVVVHRPGKGKKSEMPYGGALNYVDGKWEVQVELAEVEKHD